ncbi:hypothetical protein AMAG_14415 [Allomyces macrogynus ATCC 38327]|uniref:DUF7029 domain-containing protein n=1 Tax=Allomyces macrogynus (strain ATCC 38327) TaxID=578462 RepID=A0A0L0T6F4_ALLM3|nr:hypothetical protein AMAG_14415 [Allomyces macrogynus ATCC 38327]|eukprot:KNE70266.1 hypothetical protein AMAG_14415 [Allomyces macrogynus ATCC 38327]
MTKSVSLLSLLLLLALHAVFVSVDAAPASRARHCTRKQRPAVHIAPVTPAPTRALAATKSAVVAPQKPAAEMHAVAVPRTDYTPRHSIQAAYAHHEQQTATPGVIVQAACTFTTTKPAVNLANMPAIRTVTCGASDAIKVHFESAQAAQAAVTAWSAHHDLGMLLPPGVAADCGGTDALARSVTNVTLVDGGSAVVVNARAHDELIESYNIEVTQYTTAGANTTAPSLSKRGVLDWVSDGLSKLKFPVGVNYDVVAQKVVQANLPIAASHGVTALCANCFAAGEVGLRVKLVGSIFKLSEYTVSLVGDLKANADLQVSVPKTAGPKDLIRGTLTKAPMHPVKVGKFFELRPSLFLDAAIEYDVSTMAADAGAYSLQTGFNVDFPFTWSMSAPGFTAKPKLSTEGKPVVTPHLPHGVLTNAAAKIAAHVRPSFALDGSVFLVGSFGVAVHMDSMVGVEATVAEVPRVCAAPSTFLSLFQAHAINVDVQSALATKTYPLWTMPARPIECKFCGVCLKDDGSLPAANATRRADTTSKSMLAPTTSEGASAIEATSAPVSTGSVTQTVATSAAIATTTVV